MQRILFDQTAIDRARTYLATDPETAKLVAGARQALSKWVAKSSAEIRALLPDAPTRRALMVNPAGCPVHGGGIAVYQPFGTQIDLDLPLQVRCPIGGEVYPNPDFPDDGQGWLDDRSGSPTRGQRYYFVGWFAHWMWHGTGGLVKRLAQLWVLTGQAQYLRAGQALLGRISEVYPNLRGEDLTYNGSDFGIYIKMTGTFWEGPVLTDLARGVDLFLPDLPEELVRSIYERVYRSAYQAYRARPASHNWGNLWNTALAAFARVLNDNEIRQFLLEEHPAAVLPTLDNQFFRDGMPHEASLSYAQTYLQVAQTVAEALTDQGSALWNHPHLRVTYSTYADLVCLDRFTHFAADMGALQNDGWTLPRSLIESAYRHYGKAELARYLWQAMALSGAERFQSLDDLFQEPLDRQALSGRAKEAPPERSTLAAVRGLAIARSGRDEHRTALYFDYGFAHRAHHHADRLNINLFARGREWLPEMGYPEYMDSQAPATGGWTTHTVCHVTVEVNACRQAVGVFGDLHAFVETDGVRLIDASCEDVYAYQGVDRYRRTLLLIDCPDGGSYVVDLFRVRGGKQHDYLFHGPPVAVAIQGITLSAPAQGTLSGPEVAFGQAPPGVMPYDWQNSGYQYLFNVRQGRFRGPIEAAWTVAKDTLYACFVADGEETLFLAEGYPRPSSKSLPPMPFLVRRRHAGPGKPESRFVTVLSVNQPVQVEQLAVTGSGSAVALRVCYPGGEDLILATLSTDGQATAAGVSLQGMVGVVQQRHGKPVKATLIGASKLEAETIRLTCPAPVTEARVEKVENERLVLDRPLADARPGEILLADRGPIRSAYRIEGIAGSVVTVSPTTWLGQGRVATGDGTTGLVCDGRQIFPLGHPSIPPGGRNYYAGAWLVNATGSAWYRLRAGGDEGFSLADGQDRSRLGKDFPVGDTFQLYDLGPGDRVYRLTCQTGTG